MALLDAQVGVLANQAENYFISGNAPRRMGNAHPNIVPYQVFPAADGHLIIACGNDGQFQRLCGVLGCDGLASDPAFATNSARVASRETLVPKLAALTVTLTRDDLLARLECVGVPAGPINTVADVFEDPQVRHRGMKLELPAGAVAGGQVPSVRTPIRFRNASLVLERAAPRLDEDGPAIRASLDV